MKYRRVGGSGLKVSEVSIGGWITMGGTIDDAQTHEILRVAVERGINFVDLADVYANGEAERVAGAALKDFQRSSLVISSKCYWPTREPPTLSTTPVRGTSALLSATFSSLRTWR